MKAPGGPRSHALIALALLVVMAALALAACGGTSSTAASSPSATPTLPTQTVAGTLVFTKVVKPAGYKPGDYPNYDIYLVRSDGTDLRRLTDGPGPEEHAYWSPDGKRIVYGARGTKAWSSVWVMNADGSGKVELGEGMCPFWSPDGEQIVYSGRGVSVMNADGSGQRSVLDETSEALTPSWAPNGTIVFVRGGDLYAVNPDGSGLVRLTKNAGMLQCAVSPDGTTVVAFVPKKDRIVAVPLQGGAAPVTLLNRASHYFPDGGEPTATWTSDGRKLVLGSSNIGETRGSRLYLVNADGSGLSMVPNVKHAICPAWRPE